MQHAKLSPSSSSRWLTCTASVEASAQYDKTTNASAEWGTIVHDLGEKMLKNLLLPTSYEGFGEVTNEMIGCAEEYADYCRTLIRHKSVVLIEEQFDLSFIAPNTFGTGDFSVLTDGTLHIVDLKTGHNIVYADNNSQLMLYALGAIEHLESIGYDIDDVTLHIMQSRINHVDTCELTYDELMKFKAHAQSQAKKILSGDTTFNPNQKACQWCPHKVNCKALKDHVEQVVTGSFENLDDIDGQADLIDTEHIKKILDNADLIKSFIDAVQTVALERMQSGVKIDGYKLVEGRSVRKWTDEEKVEKYLNDLNDGMDYYAPRKLLPMTNILKILKKDDKIKEFLVKPEGKPTIAQESDRRPPINGVADCFYDEDL